MRKSRQRYSIDNQNDNLTEFMNKNSFVENSEYLETDQGDATPSKADDSVYLDESLYMDEPSQVSERSMMMDSPRSPERSGRSPRKSRGSSRVQLNNDMGQIRLTSKMREKEKEVRKLYSVQKNRTLRQSEKQKLIGDFVKYIDILI